MADKLYEENDVRAIANSIRTKLNNSNTYKISQMSTAIDSIPSAIPSGSPLSIIANGDYDVRNYSDVSVLVGVDNKNTTLDNVFDIEGETILSHITTLPMISVDATKIDSLDYFFENLSSLESLPSFQSIGGYPFRPTSAKGMCKNCTALLDIDYLQVDFSLCLDYSECFMNCKNLEIVQLQTNSATNLDDCFNGCSDMIQVLIQTSNVTSMKRCFYNCEDLTNINTLQLSNITNDGMKDMYYGCTSFNDNDIVQIMQSCMSTVNLPTQYKTLKFIGFDPINYPANYIQGLSAYNAFLSAGWSIGY